MSIRPSSVALVMDHPAQQFAHALRLLSCKREIDLRVHYWSVDERMYDAGFGRSVTWDIDLLGGYEWSAPPKALPIANRIRWFVRELRSTRPDAVVCYGWVTPIARLAIAYCLATRTPLVFYGDTTWQHASRGKRSLPISVALRILMRFPRGAISTGTFNREFYIRYGMDPSRIWPGVCPADTKQFENARPDDYGITKATRPVKIGFAGKLIARKGVDELLRAMALVHGPAKCDLTIIGDGPLMIELQALSAQLNLGDRVIFHGFANTSEMPKLLSGFDIVVVPSRRDMRTLVTIEAMAAGAALIVSDATAVWGVGDLVQHGVTGLVYPSGQPEALAMELNRLLHDPALLAELRRNGADRATRYGPSAFADSTASAVLACLSATKFA